jgi:hypothetical protein
MWIRQARIPLAEGPTSTMALYRKVPSEHRVS